MKFKWLPFLFFLGVINAFGQKKTSSYKEIIYKLDGEPFKSETIRSQLIKLSPTDQLNNYFRQIKDTLIKDRVNEDRLGRESFSEYSIKNITQTTTACSLEAFDKGALQKIIAINLDYYYPKVNPQFQKAMFIWIIGHELKHLQRGGSSEDNELELITNELLCDETGGYLVGRLTDDITLEDLNNILTNILFDIGDNVFTTKLKYRIDAAKAGWLRGKARMIQKNQKQVIKDITVRKTGDGISDDLVLIAKRNGENFGFVYRKSTNGSLYWGTSNLNGDLNGDGVNFTAGNSTGSYSNMFLGSYKDGVRDGFFRTIWENEEYEGGYTKNARDGYGRDIWYSGEKKGQKYQGQFKDDNRNGFGVYYLKNKDNESDVIFMGEWKNGLKDGKGVLFAGEKVIVSGCWSKDVATNGDCE